jgi:glutamate dehydrogenase
METDFPDGALGRPLLARYFPKRLQDSYAEQIEAHTLRREIVATAAINAMVNQAGITFLSRLTAGSQAGIGEVVAAYLEADDGTGAQGVREAILASPRDALGQQRALLEVEEKLEALVRARLEGKQPRLDGALLEVEARARG